jgi:hypothetical protein
MAEEVYLGDAVYASFDGWHIWLRTGDGNNQRIALEPQVFERLVGYQQKLKADYLAAMAAASTGTVETGEKEA